jgi:hypothetical protein
MNERMNVKHPLWGILDYQGRTLAWLARATGFSQSHIWAMKGGRFEPSADFRNACVQALGLPEWALFHGAAPDAQTAPIEAVA